MKISVVIPAYNSEKTIITSVDSVKNELISNNLSWEIIIVNDGSTDNTEKLLEEYLKDVRCSNIKVIYQSNAGAAVARNTGIKNSTGELLAFNDADDYWIRGRLYKQIEYLSKHPDVVMVAGNYGEDRMCNSFFKKLGDANIITIKDQIFKNYFSPPTVIFRSDFLNKTGLFNENMRYFEEGYLFNKMVVYGKCVLLNFKASESITGKYRWGDSGLSGNLLKMEKGELFNLKQAFSDNFISFPLFFSAYIYSILKFIRRWILSKIRKQLHN